MCKAFTLEIDDTIQWSLQNGLEITKLIFNVHLFKQAFTDFKDVNKYVGENSRSNTIILVQLLPQYYSQCMHGELFGKYCIVLYALLTVL